MICECPNCSRYHHYASEPQAKAEEKECEPMMVKCESCGYEASVHMPKQGDTATLKIPLPAKDEVEELVLELTSNYIPVDEYKRAGWLHSDLKRLIRLARGEKK